MLAARNTKAYCSPEPGEFFAGIRDDLGQVGRLVVDAAGRLVKPFDPKRLLEVVREVLS